MNITHRINKIQFSILSPQEIINLSEVEVTKPLTYENGHAVPNGLNDLRMGTIEYGEKCKSCELDQARCPGHFGHISLETPVFNPLYINTSRMGNGVSIKSILECICIKCAKLLIDPSDNIYKINNKKRVNYLKDKIGTTKVCKSQHGCGTKQPKYSFGKYNKLYYCYGGGKEELRTEYVLNVFKRISNETIETMGLSPIHSRPEWMILTVLPVPPPSIRPAIKSETAKHEDDLVSVFIDIIKANTNLRKNKESKNMKAIINYEELLNVYIGSMMTGKVKGENNTIMLFSTGGKPLKPIKSRLSTKDGRMRGNLNGKRVDFSGRTVITPDPNLSLDQLGMPIEMAMILTFPEVITKENMESMRRLIFNGSTKYPGANSLKQKDGSIKVLKYIAPEKVVLQEGDIIDRHLQDGDIVLFNRQPSLHRMSMMGFRLVILPEKTFRMNVSITTPFNADFDGDEMNVFVPQSKKTAIEVLKIAGAQTQIVAPAKSTNIVGILQDSLVGSYKLTSGKEIPITRRRFNNMMIWNDNFKGNMHNKKFYTGADIMSKILPPINYKSFSSDLSDEAEAINNLIKYIKTDGIITNIENVGFIGVPDIRDTIINKIIQLFTLKLTQSEIKILNVLKKKVENDDIKNIKIIIEKLEYLTNRREKGEKINISIEAGELKKGQIAGKLLKPGGADSNLIYITWEDIGKDEARFFIDRIQRIINQWLIEEGHTISVRDLVPANNNTEQEITFSTLKTFEAYNKIINDIIDNKLIPGIGRTVEEEFEFQSQLLFGDLFNGKIPKILLSAIKKTDNHMFNMVDSGSKGSSINITQIQGCVGQQIIGGKRIPQTYNERTLPCFEKFTDEPTSRGFVENSYVNGLSPHEFFFHMASGREGNIDTAIKSVSFDTPIIISIGGKMKCVLIGKWIDKLLEKNKDKIIVSSNELHGNVEFLNIEDVEIKIPTTNNHGDISWGNITALTRHDPTKEMYKIKTLSGRDVIVTNSHSLLVWNNDNQQYEKKLTSDVKIGEFVPVTNHLSVEISNISITCNDYNDGYICGKKYGYFDTTHINYRGLDNTHTNSNINPNIINNSNEYILGFIKGYIDNNHHKMNNILIEFSAPTVYIRDILIMLLNRLGIICYIEGKILSIKEQSAIIQLNDKNYKPLDYKNTTFKDKIISITKIDYKYSKVYDLTVPSTLNFGLANGLHVVDTADSGYISRKLVKAMEDLIVGHDMIIRNSVGRIIQYIYGDNGFDPIYLRHVKLNLINTDNNKMKTKYLFTDIKNKEDEKLLYNDYLKLLYYRKLLREYIYSTSNMSDIEFLSPFNINRIITDINEELAIDEGTILDPIYVLKKVNGLCKLLPKLYKNCEYMIDKYIELNDDLDNIFIINKNEDHILNEKLDINLFIKQINTEQNQFIIAILLTKIYIKSILSPKQVTLEYKLSKEKFDYLIDTLIYKFAHGIVDSATNVGTIAAQSIGEPTTQSTLNTFHHAGVGAKSNVIMGLPRIKELLSATKNIKTPLLTTYINPEHSHDKYKARIIANTIEYTTLRNFTKQVELWFDPYPKNTVIKEDSEFIKEYFKNTLSIRTNPIQFSKFVIRIVLDKTKIIYKQLRMNFIKLKIDMYHNREFYCIPSDDNSEELILHIRLNVDNITTKKKNELELMMDYKDIILDNIVIRGIPGISSAQIDNTGSKIVVYNKEGERKLKDEWVVYTYGTNLRYTLSQANINNTRTVSNDILEIYNILGIEAARQLLYDQLEETYSQTGANIDYHHLGLLVDTMTHYGKITPINRHGINRTDTSIICKASFEETLEQLSEAAIYGDTDNVKGMSANIILGQTMNCGTHGLNNIIYDYQSVGVSDNFIEDMLDDDIEY